MIYLEIFGLILLWKNLHVNTKDAQSEYKGNYTTYYTRFTDSTEGTCRYTTYYMRFTENTKGTCCFTTYYTRFTERV